MFFANSGFQLTEANSIAQSAIVIFFALERLLILLTKDYKCFVEDRIKDVKQHNPTKNSVFCVDYTLIGGRLRYDSFN